ncbi:MAG TPA: PAS domain S-box protein [Thermoanaerobaculia bacterium]|jgi:PAS domain S-box-containing protein
MKDQLVAASGDVFRKIVANASDFCIILLDEGGHVEMWNAGATATFGYTAEEVLGRHFSFIFTDGDKALEVPRKELSTARKEGRAEDTRWHVGKGGRLLFMDGVTMAVRDDDGQLIGFSKFGRDVTDRHRSERRIATQIALTNLLSEDQPYEITAREVMRTVCESLGWDLGALWEVRDEVLVCIEHWQAPGVDATAAQHLCEGTLSKGRGLLGEVWEKGEAMWVPDFSDPQRFPRALAAQRAGLRSAVAFPILAAGRFVGAMEFFSHDHREPEQALMPVITLIGGQIGDFIERRRTLAAMRESEERFRLIAETAQDAIFTIDEHSIITFSNPAVERIFGYSPEELKGRPLSIIIPPRLRESHRRGLERYLRTRERNIPWTGAELPALHKDGHEFECEISFGEWTSGGRTIFTGLARDITERKRVLEQEQRARAEAESVREQLERRADEEAAFRHLASALTGAVEMTEVLYEITNRATHVTRADGVYVERIVYEANVTQVEVVAAAGRGTPPRGLRVAFPGSMTDEIVQNGKPVVLADMQLFGQHMAPYLTDTCPDCEVLVTPLSADREPLGALVLLNSRASGRHFRDGDIIRARTLGDLTSLALRRVRLLEQEREAKEKAETAVRVRDETLGIVSHDLRNPLTKIVISADLLAGSPPDEQPELVDTIRTAARQMERLIQDLLDVARLESGNLTVSREDVDPASIVREMCESNERVAQQKQQRIICNVSPALPLIHGDRDRLVQVFGNLIGNAMKFTPERGQITIDARPDGKHVRFTVRDTGPGIPEADLKKVFTPYWQAKKTAHMGAGLGLAIVRGIVEAHGGQVWADNAPGGGAVFTFTIPTADRAET